MRPTTTLVSRLLADRRPRPRFRTPSTIVAKAQQTQIITNRVLSSILLGATEQISCSSCGSGFGSIGSLALGAHGRLRLSDQLTAMGGISYNQWSSDGITVNNAPTVAGSLVYDFSQLGSSRPFIEVGGGLTPYEQVKYSRNYPNGDARRDRQRDGRRSRSVPVRAGRLGRPAHPDRRGGGLRRLQPELDANGRILGSDDGDQSLSGDGRSGLDTLNVARIGGQYTHLFNGNIEANVSAGVAYGFGAGSGNFVNVYDFGPIRAERAPQHDLVRVRRPRGLSLQRPGGRRRLRARHRRSARSEQRCTAASGCDSPSETSGRK